MFKDFLRCKSIAGPIVIMIATLFVFGCSKKIAPVGGSTGLSNDGSPSTSSKAPSKSATSKKMSPKKGSRESRSSSDSVGDEEMAKRSPSNDGTSKESPLQEGTDEVASVRKEKSLKEGTDEVASVRKEDLSRQERRSSKSPRSGSEERSFGDKADKGASDSPERGRTQRGSGPGLSNNGPSFMKNVYFDYDKAMVRRDAKATLEENSRWLALNSDIKILIEGHGDERGTNDYNLALGERRARSIMRYLINLGINESRFSFISYGEERSVCSEKDETCYQKNRRVHFLVKR